MNQELSNYWLTHFEKSKGKESPNYEASIKYFEKFCEKTDLAKMFTFGISPQGREIKCLIVSNNNEFSPQKARQSGKAIVLIQNGIHSGEIEGKDACMLMLRDILITEEKKYLLNNLILLIIPVFNVDGHERLSAFNRPNQDGPKKMGWRTNALNLNLNRDYMKADTPEMKSWLRLFSEWLPDFMIDNHTTNGADYQYHVMYGIEKHSNISSKLSSWVKEKYLPHLIKNVENDGFLTGPYFEFKNNNFLEGIFDLPSSPRFSHGYCAAQNRVCLLVETHSLKPFDNRVYSTLSMMVHTLNYLNKNYAELTSINKKADIESVKKYYSDRKQFPLGFADSGKDEKFIFKGFEFYDEESSITGSAVRKYTKNKMNYEVSIFNKPKIVHSVSLPDAYFIPKEFSDIVEIIKLHGVRIDILADRKKYRIEKYRFKNAKFWPRPYEGRQMVNPEVEIFKEEAEMNEGTFVVQTNQRTMRVIVNLLEPMAPDSFLRWGFFNAYFERKEYAESYIMEPIAKRMIKKEPHLNNDFLNLLENDEEFRNNPGERLDFFYRRSKYFDKGENIYPIMRYIK